MQCQERICSAGVETTNTSRPRTAVVQESDGTWIVEIGYLASSPKGNRWCRRPSWKRSTTKWKRCVEGSCPIVGSRCVAPLIGFFGARILQVGRRLKRLRRQHNVLSPYNVVRVLPSGWLILLPTTPCMCLAAVRCGSQSYF